jgi:hypothetical protein
MTKASRGSPRLLSEFRLDDCRKIAISLTTAIAGVNDGHLRVALPTTT